MNITPITAEFSSKTTKANPTLHPSTLHTLITSPSSNLKQLPVHPIKRRPNQKHSHDTKKPRTDKNMDYDDLPDHEPENAPDVDQQQLTTSTPSSSSPTLNITNNTSGSGGADEPPPSPSDDDSKKSPPRRSPNNRRSNKIGDDRNSDNHRSREDDDDDDDSPDDHHHSSSSRRSKRSRKNRRNRRNNDSSDSEGSSQRSSRRHNTPSNHSFSNTVVSKAMEVFMSIQAQVQQFILESTRSQMSKSKTLYNNLPDDSQLVLRCVSALNQGDEETVKPCPSCIFLFSAAVR